MIVSIVIPVYNEVRTLRTMLNRVEAAKLLPGMDREIIIVNDGSSDGTTEVLNTLKNRAWKIYHHKTNLGKGAALRTGYSKCKGDIIIIQDADMEYDPNEYSKLLKPIIDGLADVVYGSRFAGGEHHRILYFWHSIGNKVLTLFSNIFTNLNLTDMEVCYKVFKKEIIDRIELRENRFGIEPEFTAKVADLARREKVSIYEVGISYHGRTYDEGKKIGLKDAFRTVFCIWKYNTVPFAKLIKYLTHGGLIISFQLLLMILLINALGLKSILGQNIANIISIEASIVLAFFLHSGYTWNASPITFDGNLKLLLRFQKLSLISLTLRIVLFLAFSLLTLNPYLNCLLGGIIAGIVNYPVYERKLFGVR